MASVARAGGKGTVKFVKNHFPKGMKNKRKRKLRKIREQKEDAALAAQRKREALDEEYAAEWEDFQSRTSKR